MKLAPATVQSDEDVRLATDWLINVRKKRREIEAFFSAPINGLKAEMKKLQIQRDDLIAPLELSERTLTARILSYRHAQTQIAARAQAKLNAAYEKKVERADAKGRDVSLIAPPALVVAPAKSVQTDAGTVTARTITRHEITDESLIPDEYWIVDEAGVAKAVRAGIGVPGVRIWIDEILSVRP